jgi:hypothetical protein
MFKELELSMLCAILGGSIDTHCLTLGQDWHGLGKFNINISPSAPTLQATLPSIPTRPHHCDIRAELILKRAAQ